MDHFKPSPHLWGYTHICSVGGVLLSVFFPSSGRSLPRILGATQHKKWPEVVPAMRLAVHSSLPHPPRLPCSTWFCCLHGHCSRPTPPPTQGLASPLWGCSPAFSPASRRTPPTERHKEVASAWRSAEKISSPIFCRPSPGLPQRQESFESRQNVI